MNRDDFEGRILEMWMTTRIPMTRANLQYWTGASRRTLNKRLDELAGEGILDVDVGDDAEMLWSVPGAARAIDGATSFADHERRQGIRASAKKKVAARAGKRRDDDGLSTALDLARVATALERRGGKAVAATGDGSKSLAVGAALGLLGPIGWLYAGSLKETVPAAVLMVLIFSILPSFLLFPILPLLLPLSAIVGATYAWQHNKTGERATLFLDSKKDEERG